MDMKGQHLIIDAYDCQSDILNKADKLEELLTNAIDSLGMEILSTHFHSFLPQGVTGVIGISTSHVSIHTWPEHGYVAMDLYTCGDQHIWPALEEILKVMAPNRVEIFDLNRGEVSKNTPIMRKINFDSTTKTFKNSEEELFQLRDDKGNDWDKIQLEGILRGKHDILFNGTSPFQDVLLVKANDLRLYLDQELQFSSIDEKYYHEALVFPVMELAASNERILILGGGDGLALREVLKYPNVKHVDLVDICPMVTNLAKTDPDLLTQNNRSMLDPRVNVHVEDAKKFILGDLEKYDVIIIDFPDPVNSVISSLYTKELFSQVAKLLAKDGVLVCQSNSSEDAPKTYWSIGETIKESGLNILPYNNIVPSFGIWGYHLASYNKFSNEFPKISVPHQALSANFETLFEIPPSILLLKDEAIVNDLDNLVLHEVYQEEIKDWYK